MGNQRVLGMLRNEESLGIKMGVVRAGRAERRDGARDSAVYMVMCACEQNKA